MDNTSVLSLEEFISIVRFKIIDHWTKIIFKISPEIREFTLRKFLSFLPEDTTLKFGYKWFDNQDKSKDTWLKYALDYVDNSEDDLVFCYSYNYKSGDRSIKICSSDDHYYMGITSDFVIYDVNVTNNSTNKEGKREGNIMRNLNTMMKKFMPEKLHDEVAFGMAGNLTVKAADGNYYYYDGHQLINVYDMVIPSEGMAILIPTQTLAEGDIIKYNGSFYHITKYSRDEIIGINLSSGVMNEIKMTTNVLGVSAFYKVVTFMDMMGGTETMLGSNANPFGWIMMMSLFNDNETSDSDNPMMKMMQMQMMSQMFCASGTANNPFSSMFGQPVKAEETTPE